MDKKDSAPTPSEHDTSKRDFIHLTCGCLAAVGAASAIWPLVDSMNPAADTLALASTEVDISKIPVGQSLTVTWRGKPVFIRHRTPEEIAAAVADDSTSLIDPEADSLRTKKKEWLVVVGICTHLGCVPSGQKIGDVKGDFNGWFCPCHGSHYDASGRIRQGPAPKNLAVPPYEFLSDTVIKIG